MSGPYRIVGARQASPGSTLSPATAARSFDPQTIAGPGIEVSFPGQIPGTPRAHESIAAGFSRRSAAESPRTALAAVGEQGDLSGNQEFEFAHDAVSSAVRAGS